MSASLIKRAAEIISSSKALIISAGAGMGVDSGLPDFRGNEGFWKAYPALGKAKINFVNIASPTAFRNNPRMAWGFYGHRLELYRRIEPHHGFHILKRWAEKMPDGFSIFTSNVDGQFQKAGFNPQNIHECHGSIHHLQCFEPCCYAIWEADDFIPEVDNDACMLLNDPPLCRECKKMARPNILMFGDWSWIADREEAQGIRQSKWLSQISNAVIVELGAGTAVPTVRRFSEYVSKHLNAPIIRINLREPEVPRKTDIGLPMGALDGLKAIASELGGDWAV